MNSEIYDFLSRKTNQQIVIEHINPYAYQCIPKNLAADIRSYHMDINLLDHMYNYYYRTITLYTDLMYYLNNPRIHHDHNMPIFFDIIRRFYSNKTMNNKEVAEKFYKLCYDGNDERILCNRIRTIIGMLTPTERTDFINRYLFS